MDRQLKDYLPVIMQQYEELKQMMSCEQSMMEELWEAIEDLTKEGFVEDETQSGAKRWESILEITPKDTDTIEIRNFRIKGRLQESLPYTYRVLENLLKVLCGEKGFRMVLQHDDYTLTIRLSLDKKSLFSETEKLADRITPANLILDVQIAYNTHGMLKAFTHKACKKFQYGTIKEAVF